jgi:hypothetical protein
LIHLSDLLAATNGVVHGPVFADAFSDFALTPVPESGRDILAVVTEKATATTMCWRLRKGGDRVLCQRPPTW